jgi:Sigma-70, region 4
VAEPSDLARLNEREKQALRLFFAGLEAKEIAREFSISPNTVNQHLRDARRFLASHEVPIPNCTIEYPRYRRSYPAKWEGLNGASRIYTGHKCSGMRAYRSKAKRSASNATGMESRSKHMRLNASTELGRGTSLEMSKGAPCTDMTPNEPRDYYRARWTFIRLRSPRILFVVRFSY